MKGVTGRITKLKEIESRLTPERADEPLDTSDCRWLVGEARRLRRTLDHKTAEILRLREKSDWPDVQEASEPEQTEDTARLIEATETIGRLTDTLNDCRAVAESLRGELRERKTR